MRRDLLHYDLPAERIASRPTEARDGARMMVLDADATSHSTVRELDGLLAPGALLVVNDTRVIPARLLGHKEGSGGKAELLLLLSLIHI